MGKEIEMKDAESPSPLVGKDEAAVEEASVLEQLTVTVSVIDRAVRAKETRTVFNRVLRQVAGVRRRMQSKDLRDFVTAHIPPGNPSLEPLLAALDEADTAAMSTLTPSSSPPAPATSPPLPEVEALAFLLVTLLLVNGRQWAAAHDLASSALARLAAFNRRTLDVLGARLASLLSLCAARAGRGGAALRAALLAAHQTAALRRDEVGQETLLNCLLAGLLDEGLYEQADALRARAQRPDTARDVQQLARYLYHLGRIHAVRLDYSEAKECLQQAVRKAPLTATGFRVAATKWLTVVRLLLGESLDRGELTRGELARHLAPYLALTQAVRSGDLAEFAAALHAHEPALRADRLLTVVGRLRHSVIRSGLRRVAAAYSRISLADVAAKLGLAGAGDAEAVVAKAIRDGSIEAQLDHAAGEMRAGATRDVYGSGEPAAAFHARIAFCMDIHNEALKAMRYESLGGLQLEDADKLRERQEQELQAALEDDGMDF
ncbi:RPN3 [Auxenochlorella protothecoides x Auxenochlorella symbiontica]